LHEQGFFLAEAGEGGDDGVEAFPVARRLADAAVDHEILGALRDLGVEIVHQHSQRRLGEPGPGGEAAAARRADRPAGGGRKLCHGKLHLMKPHARHVTLAIIVALILLAVATVVARTIR